MREGLHQTDWKGRQDYPSQCVLKVIAGNKNDNASLVQQDFASVIGPLTDVKNVEALCVVHVQFTYVTNVADKTSNITIWYVIADMCM